MNFNILKMKFASYLQEQQLEGNNNSNLKYNPNSDISIFMYADEFKEYITDELNIDLESEYISINDILKMEIVDGKLVDPNEVKEEEETKEDDAETANPFEEEGATEEILTGFLSELLEEDEFKSIIDADKNGEYSNEELTNFFNQINQYDEDEKNLSLEDIFMAIKDIKDDNFTLEVPETETQETIEETAQTASSGDMGGTTTSPSGGNTTTSPTSSTNPTSNDTNSSESKYPELDNMSLEDLKKEEPTAKSNYETKQNEMHSIIDGSSPEVSAMQQNVDNLFNTYMEILEQSETEEETFSEDIKVKKAEIDNQEKLINEKDKAIADKELEITQLTSSLDDAQFTVDALTAARDALSVSSDMSEEEKQAVQAQIDSLNQQITIAEQERDRIQGELDQANTDKTNLEGEKTTLEETLQQLETDLTQLEDDAEAAHPEIAEARKEYDNAKASFKTDKAAMVTNAKTEAANAQDYLNEVNARIKDMELLSYLEETLGSSTSGNESQYNAEVGNKLAEAAINTANRRNTTGWCLAGVNDSLAAVYGQRLSFGSAYQAAAALRGEVEGYEELASHFVQVDVPESELANLPAGAIVVWDKGGGSSVSEAGRKHGHISIALGDGRESSDHIQNQTTGRDVDYWVFYPIS